VFYYGGGHATVEDSGYDCSGAVSYALIGVGLLDAPLPSSAPMDYGETGPGQWITVHAHGGHAFLVIAGLRFATPRDSDPRGTRQTETGMVRVFVCDDSEWFHELVRVGDADGYIGKGGGEAELIAAIRAAAG
jgi:hypothetical protein